MGFECNWSDCDSSFVSKSSLTRHINNVHKKNRSYVCSVAECGAAFGYAYGLKRHELSVHLKERNYKCSCCSQSFATSSGLRRHERTIHFIRREAGGKIVVDSEKPVFICAECGISVNRKDFLIRHLAEMHNDNEYFKCHYCGRKLKRKTDMKKHIFTRHCETDHPKRVRPSNVRCLLCQTSYELMSQLCDHYVENHEIDLNIKTLSFSSMQEFYEWKKEIEDSTMVRFRLRNKTKHKLGFVCHRSGCYTVKSCDRRRSFIQRGSKKLNGICPSSITVHLNNTDSSCVAKFIQTHLGHSPNDKDELKFIFLRKEEREEVAKLIASGVPKRRILEGQANVTIRNNLLTYDTLWNIENSFNEKGIKNFSKPYENDFKNVEAFIDEFRESILFYKRQGERPPENKFSDCQLADEDVILVFMSQFQEKMLKKHGGNIVCIDGTRDVNPCGLFLHSLLVLDYDGEGFPAAFMFCNRNEKVTSKVFLRSIKEKMGEVVIPKTFMSDMQESHYNAWVEEMIKPEAHLHSMWYIWQKWTKHLPASNKKIRRDLYDLSIESSIDIFQEKLETFLTSGGLSKVGVDQKVHDFLRYFQNKYCNEDQYSCWSYAYRLHSGMNTSTHLESFHRTLNYLHGCGKTTTDLYSGLRSMANYLKQRINTLLGKTIGKSFPQLTALKQGHKLLEKKGTITIQKVPEGWLVPSFQEPKDGCQEIYLVQKIRENCPAKDDELIGACNLTCINCYECAHRYSCTCLENSIRLHMCKHIHTVALAEHESQQLVLDENYEFQEETVQFQPLSPVSAPEESPYALHDEACDCDIDAEKRKLLNSFSELLQENTSKEHIKIIQDCLKTAEAAINASRTHQTPAALVQR